MPLVLEILNIVYNNLPPLTALSCHVVGCNQIIMRLTNGQQFFLNNRGTIFFQKMRGNGNDSSVIQVSDFEGCHYHKHGIKIHLSRLSFYQMK